MSKKDYQSFFAKCMPFIKMSYFCKELGISKSNLSSFIKYGTYSALSYDKCNELYNMITETFEKVA